MKKVLLLLLCILPLYAVAEGSAAQKMGSFKTGDSFYVRLESNPKTLTAPNGVTVSPNVGFVKAFSGGKTDYLATVRMNEDTMVVTYRNVRNDQVIKIERYLHNPSTNALALEGEQLYVYNGIPYCGEMIVKGRLKRTVWYDAHGQKVRVYMYKSAADITEMQFYPSGKIQMTTEHFGTREAVRKVYDKEGKEAELTEAVPVGGWEMFDAYFHKKFRYNRLYSKEVFNVSITVDTAGVCVTSVFAPDGAWLTRMNGEDAVRWTPATINGQPVQYTIHRSIPYSPMDYLSKEDTFPMHCMFSHFANYNGIKWLNTRIYSFVTADTCSLQGTLEKKGDTTIVYCFDKKRGQKVAKQCYIDGKSGSKIKEGWFTYYANNKKIYEELFANDTVVQTIHYYENGMPKMIFVQERGKINSSWDTLRGYYPDGHLKMMVIPKGKKDITTYYDKQGNLTKNVKLPVYPGKVKALNKYVRKNAQVADSELWKASGWTSLDGWADFYVEIDEEGHVLHVGKGASSCSQNYKGVPLNRFEIDKLYDLLEKCILNDTTLWEPGSINGEPTSLSTQVRIKFSYVR